jgi:hypothetical protein
MSSVLLVENKHIELLDDNGLVRLLKRLLHLEAEAHEVPRESVFVPLDGNTADGGEDGRIEWESGPEQLPHAPRRLTVFQVKAQKTPPGKCKKEILTKNQDAVQPQVAAALEADGCYTLFVHESLNARQIRSRIGAFREALASVGADYWESAEIQVLGANQIADWANQYPAAALAACATAGRPFPDGLQTIESWSLEAQFEDIPYVADDQRTDAARSLGEVINEPKGVVRVTGLPGLGKSRLVYEALAGSGGDGALAERAVYIDLRGQAVPLSTSLRPWVQEGCRAIVVADNCILDVHQELEAICRREASHLSLVTVDAEIENHGGCPLLALEPLGDECIEKIVRGAHSEIPDHEVGRVTRFAQGYPGIAALIARAYAARQPDPLRLNDDTFVRRLIWGRAIPDPNAEAALEAVSVFKHIGFYGSHQGESETVVDACCSSVGHDAFRDAVGRFSARGLVERYDDYIRVRPHPLAVELAARWWRRAVHTDVVASLLPVLPERLLEAMCDRMAMLNFVPETRDVVGELCGALGPFGDAEVVVSERGSRLLRAMVEVNPEATARTLHRTITGLDLHRIKEIPGNTRMNLVWALDKLAFRRETFELAMESLLHLASEETATWSNNSTGTFLLRFQPILAGTQAPPEDRIRILDRALESGLQQQRELGIEAIFSGLKRGQFVRSGGAETQGSQPALRDWHPKVIGDVESYWKALLERLICEIERGDERARQVFAERLPWLFPHVRIGAELDRAFEAAASASDGFWPSGLKALAKIRKDPVRANPVLAARLNEWEGCLSPDALPPGQRLHLIVTEPPIEVETGGPSERVDRAAERAAALAHEVASDWANWAPHLKTIFCSQQRQAHVFGNELAKVLKEPGDFVEIAIQALRRCGPGEGEPTALGSFLRVVSEVDEGLAQSTLEEVAGDDALRVHLPDLTGAIPIKALDFNRLLEAIENGGVEATRLRSLAMRGSFKQLPLATLGPFLASLCEIGEEWAWAALDLLGFYRMLYEGPQVDIAPTITELIEHPNLRLGSETSRNLLYEWKEVIKELLPNADPRFGTSIAERISEGAQRGLTQFDLYPDLFEALFGRFPAEAWAVFGRDILAGEEIHRYRLHRILQESIRDDECGPPVAYVPDQLLLEWCTQHSPEAPTTLSGIIRPYTKGPDGPEWTPLARTLLKDYGDNQSVLSGLATSLYASTVHGSMVPELQRQQALYQAVANHPRATVSQWARKHIDILERDIERERKRDREESIGIW